MILSCRSAFLHTDFGTNFYDFFGKACLLPEARAMKKIDLENCALPFDEYPEFIGLTWDGEFYLGPKLKPLEDFQWPTYWELVDQLDEPHTITLPTQPDALACKIEAYSDLAFLLDQLPTIQVSYDSGPPDAGPASGVGYVFFKADDVTTECLNMEVLALKAALVMDLQTLQLRMAQ